MWKRIKGNLDSGVEKVKWFSSLLNERVKVEISLFSLLHRSDEMEKQKNALLKTIGGRVFELRNDSEQHILRDPAIQDAVKAIEKLDAELEDVRKRASEIEKIEA